MPDLKLVMTRIACACAGAVLMDLLHRPWRYASDGHGYVRGAAILGVYAEFLPSLGSWSAVELFIAVIWIAGLLYAVLPSTAKLRWVAADVLFGILITGLAVIGLIAFSSELLSDATGWYRGFVGTCVVLCTWTKIEQIEQRKRNDGPWSPAGRKTIRLLPRRFSDQLESK